MNDLQNQILALARPDITSGAIAAALGCNRTTVLRCLKKNGVAVKQRSDLGTVKNGSLTPQILSLSGTGLSSSQIASSLGCSAKHVQTVLLTNNAPRLTQGAQRGSANSSWITGRAVDLDGYVLVSAPPGHPYPRKNGRVYEHRLVAEAKLKRYLLPLETVDHIDGLHLHNAPSNLRVFPSNADHLRATITGLTPKWSVKGWEAMNTAHPLRVGLERVDNYARLKKLGVVRLRQILRAALQLGTDSPFLSGTLHHLTQAQIDHSSPTTIKLALDALSLE